MREPGSDAPARIMTQLRRVTREFGNQLNSLFTEELDLTLPQLITLRVISQSETAPTSTEVAEKINLAPSTVCGIIKRLIRDGLLERHQDPDDLRVHRLSVTDRGKETVYEAEQIYQDYARSMLSGFTSEELKQFYLLLEKLYTSLESRQLE